MLNDLRKLFKLRQNREKQAETQVIRLVAAERVQEARLRRLEAEAQDLSREVAEHIEALYHSSVGRRFSPADLDTLAATVDAEYGREAKMQETVEAAAAELAKATEDVAEARRVLAERTRAVRKLDLTIAELKSREARMAELLSEDEAERPHGTGRRWA